MIVERTPCPSPFTGEVAERSEADVDGVLTVLADALQAEPRP